MTSVELEKTELSDEQVEKLWEAFKVFDEDGSGANTARLREIKGKTVSNVFAY
ncbi:hypothetical protein [Scytonema hofmannii]|uniref:hypothetical protein n=1 Tax=Scytonema hofmannii TaxID=34078 RepID=UPI00131438B8|nr:hypothetical protein [Scytonema hofmannii]